jgi:hypothetical protein
MVEILMRDEENKEEEKRQTNDIIEVLVSDISSLDNQNREGA